VSLRVGGVLRLIALEFPAAGIGEASACGQREEGECEHGRDRRTEVHAPAPIEGSFADTHELFNSVARDLIQVDLGEYMYLPM
jgi:hypothetical protein